MKSILKTKSSRVGLAVLLAAVSAMAIAQLGEIIKVVGVTAAVAQFGPKINSELNKIAHTPDTANNVSKVVPILTGGINSRKAVGAAQVRGTRSAIAKVKAVAQIEQDLFGFKARVLIPISSKDVIKNIKPVPGVGVTGIVDISVRL